MILEVAAIAWFVSRMRGVSYPHTMYDCNTGQSVEIMTKAEHEDYTKGGWVHSFDKCPLDSPFGRDYGEFDYADSVDDLKEQGQTKYIQVFQDDAVLEGVAVYNVKTLSYDPQRERRGYYKDGGFVIGSTQLWANGAPISFNEDRDGNKRTFILEQDAIDYLNSIGKVRPTNPSKPEGEPMPEPEQEPVEPEEDTPPTPSPTPVNPSMPPSSGFGGGNFNQFSIGGGGY